ncbi:MAG TPA: hypothetical protein VNR65_14005, partial [Geobacterales bacterium]|nr:hypothetical protein [Geobacterales bacterium]
GKWPGINRVSGLLSGADIAGLIAKPDGNADRWAGRVDHARLNTRATCAGRHLPLPREVENEADAL